MSDSDGTFRILRIPPSSGSSFSKIGGPPSKLCEIQFIINKNYFIYFFIFRVLRFFFIKIEFRSFFSIEIDSRMTKKNKRIVFLFKHYCYLQLKWKRLIFFSIFILLFAAVCLSWINVHIFVCIMCTVRVTLISSRITVAMKTRMISDTCAPWNHILLIYT